MQSDDASSLKAPTEQNTLDALRRSYLRGQIYTQCDIILLSMNPFASANIYGAGAMKAYLKNYGHVVPHIYSVSESAMQSLPIKGNQTIIVSGESGSGKTINSEHLLDYIVWRSGGNERLSRLLLGTHLILESFGNAKTQINQNSSRFGKFLTLQFVGGRIAGGKIAGYLLEKSRVTHQAAGNKNFHIFYMVCASERLSVRNDYISHGHTDADMQRYAELEGRFRELGLGGLTRIKQILLAVIHMGSLRFVDRDGVVELADSAHLDLISSALGLAREELESVLLKGHLACRDEVLVTMNSLEKARLVRDTIARRVYAMVFQHVVDLLNSHMHCAEAEGTISILDIYGFEVFERNNFDQFCINWANERIQSEFIRRMFQDRQKFYAAEGIPWLDVDFPTNDDVLRLIEKRCGLADLVEEESLLPCRSIDSLFVKVLKYNADEPSFLSTKAKSTIKIDHFACPVEYRIDDFLEKNAEEGRSLPPLSLGLEDAGPEQPSGPRRRGSFVRYFRDSMNLLFSLINETEIHYVRCIRPNRTNTPWDFDTEYVKRQIKACGAVEAIRLSQLTYPHVVSKQTFRTRYGWFASLESESEGRGGCRVGKNYVFLKNHAMRDLETRRNAQLQDCRRAITLCAPKIVPTVTLNRLRVLAAAVLAKERERASLEENERERHTDTHADAPTEEFPAELLYEDCSMHDGKPFRDVGREREEVVLLDAPGAESGADGHHLVFVGSDLETGGDEQLQKCVLGEATADPAARPDSEAAESGVCARVPPGQKAACENCRSLEIKYRLQSEALKKKKLVEEEIDSLRAAVARYEQDIAAYRELIKDMTISANQAQAGGQDVRPAPEKALQVSFANPHDVFGCLIDIYIEYAPAFTTKSIPRDEMLSFAHVAHRAITEIAAHAQSPELFYLEMLVYEVSERVQRFDQDIHRVAFMVSNLVELKFLARRHGAELPLDELEALIRALFEHFCELQKDAMAPLLPDSVIYHQAVDGFRCEDSFYKRFFVKTPSVLKLVNHLDYLCSMMVYFALPEAFICESLRFILQNINSTCFNRILVEKNFLSFNRSTQINFNINVLQKFCQEIGFLEGISALGHLRDVIRLVNLAKSSNTLDVVRQECTSLNDSQLGTLASQLECPAPGLVPGTKSDVDLFLAEPKVATPTAGSCTDFVLCIPRFVPTNCIAALLASLRTTS